MDMENKKNPDSACMKCAKEMMDGGDDKKMCMKECSAEMEACKDEKDEDAMMDCMKGAMEKNPEGRCMMCKKKMDGGDKDDKMMCKAECGAEMKKCEAHKDSEEDMKRCMRAEIEKAPEGKCMMCKKKAMEDDEEKEMMSKCKDKCSAEMESCKGKDEAEMKKCMMMEMKKQPDNECMMCAKDMMDDDDKMMMCDEACAGEMKACEGSKDNKEDMMRCMRGEVEKAPEGKCMMCKKKMDKGDDDDKKMCMKECSVEMEACKDEKDEDAMMGCMKGEMEKKPEGRCMMCKKKMDGGDKDDKMMCKAECGAEMKKCEAHKDSEEDMKRCMRAEIEKAPEGKCMMCKKKAMEDDEEK